MSGSSSGRTVNWHAGSRRLADRLQDIEVADHEVAREPGRLTTLAVPHDLRLEASIEFGDADCTVAIEIKGAAALGQNVVDGDGEAPAAAARVLFAELAPL